MLDLIRGQGMNRGVERKRVWCWGIGEARICEREQRSKSPNGDHRLQRSEFQGQLGARSTDTAHGNTMPRHERPDDRYSRMADTYLHPCTYTQGLPRRTPNQPLPISETQELFKMHCTHLSPQPLSPLLSTILCFLSFPRSSSMRQSTIPSSCSQRNTLPSPRQPAVNVLQSALRSACFPARLPPEVVEMDAAFSRSGDRQEKQTNIPYPRICSTEKGSNQPRLYLRSWVIDAAFFGRSWVWAPRSMLDPLTN